jgi:DNA-binding NarL/FixJ family response regulator
MGDQRVGVVVADDHPIVLDGLRAVIAEADDLELRGLVTDGETAVRTVLDERPQVVVLDVRMPGCDGIEATRRILEAYPEAKIIMLSAARDASVALDVFRAGAIGFLPKETAIDLLVESIRSAAQGRAVMSTELITRVVTELHSPQQANPLSPREVELMGFVAEGKTNEQISRAIGLSVGTVKAQLSALFTKIAAIDRASAVAVCLRSGWIS